MFNSSVLDVVIGLVFIYLLYSLLATIIQEIIATKLSYRAKFLEKAIMRMLEDYEPHKSVLPRIRINRLSNEVKKKMHFSHLFYEHPLIKFLCENPTVKQPSYINHAVFSKVMIDLLRGHQATAGENHAVLVSKALNEGQTAWGDEPVIIGKQTHSFLLSLWADSQGDLEKFRSLLENWFDETMDRVTGWYKKYIQFVLVVIGFVIAMVFNVDTIQIAGKLQKDPKLREQLVQQADAFVKANPNLKEKLAAENTMVKTLSNPDSISKAKNNIASDSALLKKQDTLMARMDSLLKEDLNKVNGLLGIGLNSFKPKSFGALLLAVLGWIITALAISLGAPFWFDLLNKLMKLKSSISAGSSNSNVAGDKNNPSVNPIKRVG